MSDFNLRASEQTVVFIDGPNLYGAAKTLGVDIDYRLLHRHFSTNAFTNRLYYYSSILESSGEIDEHVTIRPLLDWLDYNGYFVVTKSARAFTDETGRRKIKGSMIVDMAVDMLRAVMNGAKHVILFSGDGEFVPVIRAIQDMGARTTVVSTTVVSPTQGTTGAAMISDDLRRQTDAFVDLKNVLNLVTRQQSGATTVSAAATAATRQAVRA